MRRLRPLPPGGRAERNEVLGERRVVVPLAIGGTISDAPALRASERRRCRLEER
jgi:hypothetical protein